MKTLDSTTKIHRKFFAGDIFRMYVNSSHQIPNSGIVELITSNV